MSIKAPLVQNFLLELNPDESPLYGIYHRTSGKFIVVVQKQSSKVNRLRGSWGDSPWGLGREVMISEDGLRLIYSYTDDVDLQDFIVCETKSWGPFSNVIDGPRFGPKQKQVGWTTKETQNYTTWVDGQKTGTFPRLASDPRGEEEIPISLQGGSELNQYTLSLALKKSQPLGWREDLSLINKTLPASHQLQYVMKDSNAWKLQNAQGRGAWWKITKPIVNAGSGKVAYSAFNNKIFQAWYGDALLMEETTNDSTAMPTIFFTPSLNCIAFVKKERLQKIIQIFVGDKPIEIGEWISEPQFASEDRIAFFVSETKKLFWREYSETP
jgi:hypothetical protein